MPAPPSLLDRARARKAATGSSKLIQDLHDATAAIRRYEPKKRVCIMPNCTTEFVSTGPHHRMCDLCRYRS